jgi:predicted GIY-YIG superfamily endonuclease
MKKTWFKKINSDVATLTFYLQGKENVSDPKTYWSLGQIAKPNELHYIATVYIGAPNTKTDWFTFINRVLDIEYAPASSMQIADFEYKVFWQRYNDQMRWKGSFRGYEGQSYVYDICEIATNLIYQPEKPAIAKFNERFPQQLQYAEKQFGAPLVPCSFNKDYDAYAKKLYNQQSLNKKVKPQKGRYVYLLHSGKNLYKIGIANIVEKRIQELQTGSPYKIQLVAKKLHENAITAEAKLHKAFSKYQEGLTGEWFNFPQHVVETEVLPMLLNGDA